MHDPLGTHLHTFLWAPAAMCAALPGNAAYWGACATRRASSHAKGKRGVPPALPLNTSTADPPSHCPDTRNCPGLLLALQLEQRSNPDCRRDSHPCLLEHEIGPRGGTQAPEGGRGCMPWSVPSDLEPWTPNGNPSTLILQRPPDCRGHNGPGEWTRGACRE